jgi:uncharacterized protein (TIGR00369 family)
MLRMDVPALEDFLAQEFPQVAGDLRVDAVDEDGLTLRLLAHRKHLRPGGTYSGAAIFMLADDAAYCVILSRIGPKALTVTTNAGIDYLRKPVAERDLVARARILKLGRALIVVEVMVSSDGSPGPVARANFTYSVPPAERDATV